MNIFGIGGVELILIFVLMLVVAGPKRMIQWAYVMGKWVAKFRVMWSQTVDLVNQELNAAGYDVQLPKDAPTRKNVTRWAQNTLNKTSDDPIKTTLNEIKADMESLDKEVKEVSTAIAEPKKHQWNLTPKPHTTAANGAAISKNTENTSADANDFGNWSQLGGDSQDTAQG